MVLVQANPRPKKEQNAVFEARKMDENQDPHKTLFPSTGKETKGDSKYLNVCSSYSKIKRKLMVI